MRTLKILGLLLLIFNFHTGFSQVDLFTDDEDEDDNQEITYKNFMNKLTGILKQGEASPIGNWVGETLEIMTDGRFADAPQEYLMAFQVAIKVSKFEAFELAMKNLPLTCEERKKLIESYLLFLGTIYLDMYCIDFFVERNKEHYNWTFNESANIYLAINDVFWKLRFDKYDRGEIVERLKYCQNDISDPNVTDCNHSKEGELHPDNIGILYEDLGFMYLNPSIIAKITIQLQDLLASLPCNKP